MKLKKLLKQKEYQQYTTLHIIDLNNHWELDCGRSFFKPKPITKYHKKLLKCKVEDIYIDKNKMLCVKVY